MLTNPRECMSDVRVFCITCLYAVTVKDNSQAKHLRVKILLDYRLS